MIDAVFTNGSEIFRFNIDRANKRLFEASSKTSGMLIETKWVNLFDRGKETAQDSITSKMNDNDFMRQITYFMGHKYGYILKGWNNVQSNA